MVAAFDMIFVGVVAVVVNVAVVVAVAVVVDVEQVRLHATASSGCNAYTGTSGD